MDYLALGVIMCGDTRAKMLEQTSYFDLAIELEAMSPVGETWARFLDVCSKSSSLSCRATGLYVRMTMTV